MMAKAANLKVCHRIKDERSIVVCANCYNEVEGDVTTFYVEGMEADSDIKPRYSFCPWCSAPLREG